ncbi:Rhodanese-related sulfurtransferase [Pontibaca methylaminivorans]|uniref:Rhodanese-related sulfurtransferase n=2 Tax=Pontibaca methylaminivorans TaxID=515897 RepID=A0A1R3WID6_9RHOB|nr:Rhodanese-related sulfurtransferase [Pontibaca methylaminivorans]
MHRGARHQTTGPLAAIMGAAAGSPMAPRRAQLVMVASGAVRPAPHARAGCGTSRQRPVLRGGSLRTRRVVTMALPLPGASCYFTFNNFIERTSVDPSTMSIRNPKHTLYDQFAIVAKAFGNPLRLELVEHLAQGPRSVDALATRLGLPIANVSQHLQAMRRAGLVRSQRDGKFVNYHLADDSVLAAFAAIRTVAERHSAEVDHVIRDWFDRRDDMEPVSREELAARMEDGIVTVIDLRPPDEFALGHLPGAINVPLSELDSRVAELRTGREIVAYCRGPWCIMSYEAVAQLRKRGLAARRLADGLPEWQAAGMTVERS